MRAQPVKLLGQIWQFLMFPPNFRKYSAIPIDHSTLSTTGWVEYSTLPPTVTTGLTGGTWEPHLVPLTVCQGPPTTASTGTICPHRRGRRNARWRNIRMCVNIEMDYTNTLLYTYNYHPFDLCCLLNYSLRITI